jgi:putative ABC transport system permease protein
MLNVGNRKTIARLANRSLKAARLRNIMAVCAIALTSVLFTALCTLGIGGIDAFQQATMRQTGGNAHATVKYIDDETFANISDHPLVKEISYNRVLSDSVDNPELLKRRGELWYSDDAGLRHGFNEPTAGSRPVEENEIITDTKTMQLLNIPQEIGAKVTLLLTVKGEPVERDFILCGWWESDPAFNVSILTTSRAYVDAHIDELANTYREDYSMTGAVNAHIMFDNTFGMQDKLDRVLTESGYEITDEDAPNYVSSNLNWAYLSAGMGGDPITMGAMAGAALLVLLTGYLIIYNIFQISVLRDIRYYGLLKTIGATGRQIKRIIRRQAAVLSLIGIPIGLVIGYASGAGLFPLVLTLSSFAGSAVSVSANPLIFAGSAAFSAVTVWISTRRPGKIAASVSPVEAVRYTDAAAAGTKKKGKASTSGGKLHKMALSNLGRSKRRTVLVLLSLSLSLVLLNCVFTLSRGVDMDKYLDKFVDTDFLLAHADYFNSDYYAAENSVDEDTVAEIEALPGFEAGGRIYNTRLEYFTVEDKAGGRVNIGDDGFPLTAVFGLDDLPLSRLEVFEGEIDAEKLKSGSYILLGVYVDDYGQPEMDSLSYGVGDKVVLHNRRIISPDSQEREYTTQEYEIMAVAAIKGTNSSRLRISNYGFFLPTNVYLPLTYEKAVMSYAFNVNDSAEADAEAFMENYTHLEQPLLNYESKAVMVNEFNGLVALILAIGGLLSAIVALIGILNFMNATLTGTISRRREFAMMQSIGMTGKQLRNMLCVEGLYYAAGTVILSLTLGILSSLFVVKSLLGGIWFMSYRFVIMPLIACWPVFILIAALVPIAAIWGTMRMSLVDRLREAE